jgi:hypothetical protein
MTIKKIEDVLMPHSSLRLSHQPSPLMSFSRRLTVALQEDATRTPKHNQVVVEHIIYQRLLDISNGGIIVLRVTIDNEEVPAEVQEKEFFVTVVGEHAHRADVLVSQELINFFGQPIEGTRFRFTFTKKLPELTTVAIKFLENDFCFIDPRDAVQTYLEDYHILYEGMLMEIPSQIDHMLGLVRIESLKPATVCRVPNGEVELEILTDEPPVSATAAPLHLPFAHPPPIPPVPVNNVITRQEPAPFNFQEMKRELFPDLATLQEPIQTQSVSSPPLSREEVRAARLAYYAKKND